MSGAGRKGDDARNAQVIGLLNQLGERLISSERERNSMRTQIEDTRDMLLNLEGKADQAERIFLTIQDKISKQESLERAMLQRQDDLERLYRESAERLINAEALTSKIEEAIALQNRLARRLEKTAQDKARILTKIERIEDSVQKTREAVSANAMIPMESGLSRTEQPGPFWKRPVRQQLASASQVVVWILLGGLVMNQLVAHWPEKGAAAKNAVVAEAPARSEGRRYVSALEPSGTESSPENGTSEAQAEQASYETGADKLAAYDDEQLVAAMTQDPDALGEVLNRIEPVAGEGAATVIDEAQAPVDAEAGVTQASFVPATTMTEPAPAASDIEAFLKGEIDTAKPLKERITADAKLPPVIKKVEDKAFEGLPEAQHDLAAIYTAGHGGVAVDYVRAAQWFREAAVNGVANARYNLGVLYHQGLGVDRDVGKAIQWYRAAAEIGHPEAQYNLGIAAIEGIGTQYDPRQAAGFFEKAARGGVGEAAYNLGLIHENGLLGDPDMNEAVFWYKTAADRDNPEALTAFTQVIKALGLKNGDVERIMKEYKAVYKLDEATPAPSNAKQTKAEIPPPARPATMPRTETAVATSLTERDQVTPSGEPIQLTDIIPPLGKEESRSLLASINGDHAMVAQVQEQLIRLGLYPGPADGQGGPQTEDAIRSYQSQHSLEINGRPSEDLLVHMLASELNAASGSLEENGSREE